MTKGIKHTAFLLIALLTAAAALIGCSRSQGNKIVIKGSTTVLPITMKATEAYREIKKVSFSVEGSGSGNGIKALIQGSCDIANSSRAMEEKEIGDVQKKGLKIKEIVIAYDMIVPIVHPSNPITNITLTQLKAVYDGSITNWKELGGKDENIVVISRDTSSGTYEVWHEKVMLKNDVRKDALLQASNGAISTAVAGNPRAIGYVGFGYLSNKIKSITVDNVEITLDNGKSGRFPISRKLYMYVNEEKISAQAREFIDFLLSDAGQVLVKDAGFIPNK